MFPSSATFRVVVAAHDHRSAQRTPGQAWWRCRFRRCGRTDETGQGCEPLERACCIPVGSVNGTGGRWEMRCKNQEYTSVLKISLLCLARYNLGHTTSITNRSPRRAIASHAVFLLFHTIAKLEECHRKPRSHRTAVPELPNSFSPDSSVGRARH